MRTTLRDILTPGVIGVPVGAAMEEALACMRKGRISSAVALSRGKPAGILTERGVIAALAEHGPSLLSRKVRELMSCPVLTAPEHMPIHQAFSMLLEQGIRHLVVVDAKGRALGMVTQTNMVQNLGVEYFVEVKRVSQIMARMVACLSAADNLQNVLELMARGPYSCIVALECNQPAGIFTERDMVAVVADGWKLADTSLGEVMSRPVLTVSSDTPVHQASAIMRENKVRRLLVVGSDGSTEGLVTQSDIVKGMEARYVEMLKEVIREKDQLLREAVEEAAKKTCYLDTILNASMELGIAATEGDVLAFVNHAAQGILGAGEAGSIGSDILEFHKRIGVPVSRVRRGLSQVKKGNSHRFSAVIDNGASNRFINAKVSGIWGSEGKPSGYVLMVRDVTERRMAEDTIKHMAYHDALTGLPNRFLLEDRLEQGLALASRRGSLLAVMLLDLDGFKAVNDSLGHDVGDMLLKMVAGNIGGLLRKSDTLGRMGGDEFLIILPEVKTPEGVTAVARKVLKAVCETRVLSGVRVNVSTSIGLALYPWDGADPRVLIQKADAAMYKAKEAGRNTYCLAGEHLSLKDEMAFKHP
ncbi:MAG: diguanylate cyclase [Desulfovibrio sp.]|nr:diguanylate cyclase [Desulfovibrio sp.]MBI4960907.1 diguanylate cyclase [Desulfovibrio sp.]